MEGLEKGGDLDMESQKQLKEGLSALRSLPGVYESKSEGLISHHT